MKNYIHTLLRIVFSVYALAFSVGCDVTGRTVLLIGDSQISTNAEVYAAYMFSGSGNGSWKMPAPAMLPTFAVVPGAAFAHEDWIPTLQSIDAAQEFDAVVLALGINDGIAGQCTTDLANKIDALIAELPASVPIIVVDAFYPPSANYSFACLEQVNTELQAAFYRWAPRTTYINSNTVISSLPANQRFTADQVHISKAAAFKMAEAVTAALDGVL